MSEKTDETIPDIVSEVLRDDPPYSAKIAGELREAQSGDKVLNDQAASCLEDDEKYIKDIARRVSKAFTRVSLLIKRASSMLHGFIDVNTCERCVPSDEFMKDFRERYDIKNDHDWTADEREDARYEMESCDDCGCDDCPVKAIERIYETECGFGKDHGGGNA
jgi:hypothetical protein